MNRVSNVPLLTIIAIIAIIVIIASLFGIIITTSYDYLRILAIVAIIATYQFSSVDTLRNQNGVE